MLSAGLSEINGVLAIMVAILENKAGLWQEFTQMGCVL